MQCKGFLFDLDGTLVDSLPVVERTWCNWADRFGLTHDEVLSFIHGKQAITSLRHFMAGKPEEEIAAEFTRLEQIEATDTAGIVALPGAVELLDHLNKAGIPWAIVTSGSMPVARARHQAAGLPAPEVFVTAERVKTRQTGTGCLSAGRPTARSLAAGMRGGGRRACRDSLRAGRRVSCHCGQCA
ncbi:putative phosphatase [Citrobacter koseri]|uniref:Putative phosphatase n=1 Tax=Citrobacter koseri TaxID=545 RepID=A0A2X2VYW5_CITKO|nr:putative phosphatase [Citrobacter koseri]